jgi:hypothetical protein
MVLGERQMALAALQRVAPASGPIPATLPAGFRAPAATKTTPADAYTPSFKTKLINGERTFSIAVHELFGGHTLDHPQSLHKPYQRFLHQVFPGGLVTAAFSQFQPDPAGDAPSSGPLRRTVDARAWMPVLHFEKGEDQVPVDPGFDGNAEVQDNPDHYRRNQADRNQEPTVYASARQRGEYAVIRYDTYYVDNPYMNYHKHDWEGFSVYLKPDATGDLKPAFLLTNWHHDVMLTPWADLQLDGTGRPVVLVDRGSHGSRPQKRDTKVPPGTYLHPQGFWLDEKGVRPATLHLRGDTPLLRGTEPVVRLADGRDPREVDYPSSNWIAGFISRPDGEGPGPKSRPTWNTPLHPLAFGVQGSVTGQVAVGDTGSRLTR